MAERIPIPKSAIAGLSIIAKHSAVLPKLRECCSELAGSSSISKLTQQFSQASGVSESDATQIVTQLMGLHSVRSQTGIDAAELYARLTVSLEDFSESTWSKDDRKNWKSASASVIDALDARHPLSVFQKSMRLMYEYEHALIDISIVTDVRPVFDEEAKEMLRGIVANVLAIDYTEGNGSKRLFVAMDSRDIEKLRKQCERAEKKIELLRRTLANLTVPTLMPGEVDE